MTLDLVRCHKSRWHVIVADHLARDSRLYPPVPIVREEVDLVAHGKAQAHRPLVVVLLGCQAAVERGRELLLVQAPSYEHELTQPWLVVGPRIIQARHERRVHRMADVLMVSVRDGQHTLDPKDLRATVMRQTVQPLIYHAKVQRAVAYQAKVSSGALAETDARDAIIMLR